MLGDSAHIEVVAILRRTLEDPWDASLRAAAFQWLSEHHPTSDEYHAALLGAGFERERDAA